MTILSENIRKWLTWCDVNGECTELVSLTKKTLLAEAERLDDIYKKLTEN